MVFFNLIYQGYTQDHQRILKIGLGIYVGLLAVLYSGQLPESLLESRAIEFFKNYGWLLVVIDYLVLNLLHYFQTGKYLFRQTPDTPRYIAWRPESEDVSNYYQSNYYPDEYPELEEEPDEEPESNVRAGPDSNVRARSSQETDLSIGQTHRGSGPPSQQPTITGQTTVSQGINQGGSVRNDQASENKTTHIGSGPTEQSGSGATEQIGLGYTEPPFDPNYTINDDDQNVSLDQEYFTGNQEPQIIDNYAMSQSGLADASESISD